ncbi:hypothetical protein N7490_001559 [Penicillium lividum]|nr:hypothetical protein N7490_001559 [Penicillium lividum]
MAFPFAELLYLCSPADAASDKLYHQSFYHSLYLRAPREMWPVDRQSLCVYWNKEIEMLEVTDDAKAMGRVFIKVPIQLFGLGQVLFSVIAAKALPSWYTAHMA